MIHYVYTVYIPFFAASLHVLDLPTSGEPRWTVFSQVEPLPPQPKASAKHGPWGTVTTRYPTSLALCLYFYTFWTSTSPTDSRCCPYRFPVVSSTVIVQWQGPLRHRVGHLQQISIFSMNLAGELVAISPTLQLFWTFSDWCICFIQFHSVSFIV